MHAALTTLGYNTHHGFVAFANARDYELWNPACETKFLAKPSTACPKVDKEFLDKVLGNMNAVTDMPAISFAEELIAAYPEARVVLVERDIESWYRSFERVFIDFYEGKAWPFIAKINPSKVGHMYTFITNSVARCHFGANNAEEFRGKARDAYRRHYAVIRHLLRERGEESRLLEFDLKDGWAPLCRFLDKEIPKDVPFPNVNETAMIQEKIQVMLVYGIRSGVSSAIFPLTVIITLVMVYFIWNLVKQSKFLIHCIP